MKRLGLFQDFGLISVSTLVSHVVTTLVILVTRIGLSGDFIVSHFVTTLGITCK